jgi:hypothetical protein
MIIDRIRIAGLPAYLKDAHANTNLASGLPSLSRSPPAGAGRQLETSGIDVYMEGSNLWRYFERQDHPIVRVTVMKELFPGLFADPYRHRVHTLAGLNDLNAGTFSNCRACEVDGVPTLVSVEPGPCQWISARYRFPHDVTLAHAAWSLASARTPATANFSYGLDVSTFNGAGTSLGPTPIAQGFGSGNERSVPVSLGGVREFELLFKADVKTDGYFHERHAPISGSQIGRALLRSFHLLEIIDCQHDFHSLGELLAFSSGYDLFGASQAILPRLSVTLRLPTTLVTGPNEDAPNGRYEHIAIEVDPDAKLTQGELTYLSARLEGHILLRPPAIAQP